MSSDSTEVPRKRARVDSPPPAAGNVEQAPERKQDTEFWFDDGSITLIARNVEFRVYKGILASRSVVFRDMFSFPQPETSSTSASSVTCPLVHLTDSPEDIRELLRILMPGMESSTPFAPDARPTFQAVSACIRLGHKYQLDHLLEAALGYLRRYYPTDFNTYANSPAPPPSFRPIHSIGVVSLARLTGAHDLLPIALYECSSLDAAELLGGFRRDDGTREALSSADLALCIRAQATLVRAHVERAVGVSTTIMQYIPAHIWNGTCKFALDNMAHAHLGQIGAMSNTRALTARLWLWQGPPGSSPPCANCIAFLQDHDSAQRRWVWNRLPNLVGVTVAEWRPA